MSILEGALAERTGFEPATPGVTGRYSNQLNYRSVECGGDNTQLLRGMQQVFSKPVKNQN